MAEAAGCCCVCVLPLLLWQVGVIVYVCMLWPQEGVSRDDLRNSTTPPKKRRVHYTTKVHVCSTAVAVCGVVPVAAIVPVVSSVTARFFRNVGKIAKKW